MNVTRKNLMGIKVDYDLPYPKLLARAITHSDHVQDAMFTPIRRHGLIRRDMTLIGFNEKVPLAEVVAEGTSDGSQRAHPVEFLAMVDACPHLASDLGVKSCAAIAPWICQPPPCGVEEDFDAFERYCLGVRYVGIGRIGFRYWFEEWPVGYWFLFVDPLKSRRRRPVPRAAVSPAA